ncbi:nuclear transport factor 2 family protein [Delftia sp. PS-11]|uniref:nuclear transport factor 2 family protein n=1 Tax=Delftia sp. PS-11 TaxID=2767222 RepID=UPI0024579890|nr:nuclear transport factor 2 family protein [Delftia sp. PS-11]KAJ8740659.1 nuclear transport factor 2 family protein [Delftia sp. PS-11]
MNNEIDRLLARQDCLDLVLRAAACADAGDAHALAQLFAEDGVLQRPNAAPLRGRAAIAAAYGQRPAGRMTRHLVTNTLVELLGDDCASARSQVLLWSCSEADAPTAHGRLAQTRQIIGEFDDRFCRSAQGHWLIAQREARFVMFHGG